MGYQTLYRKYRSRTFGEIVGQEHVISVLRGALARDRISHAYMFSGPRGTGKTSIARIFAKALNCPNVKNGEPCGTCHVCTSITEGRSPDVIEMDAASNRGVENIEELRRAVQYVPHELKYKVYIIDEVHMISTHGFNALLKTLEEPPSHAVFVLATTEPQKLPITILSRCLRFEFRRIPFEKLAAHIKFITNAEDHRIADDAALFLAEIAEGSARDAISLLDQLIIASDNEITVELVRSLFGLTHPEAITRMVELLAANDLAGLTGSLQEFIIQGHDPEQFLRIFYEKLRDGYLGVAEDEGLATAVSRIPKKRLVLCIEALWDAFSTLRHTNHPLGLVELTLFKLAAIIHPETVDYAPPPREERAPPPSVQRDRHVEPANGPDNEREKPAATASDAHYTPRGKPRTLSVDPSKLLEETRPDLLSGGKRGGPRLSDDSDTAASGGSSPPFRDESRNAVDNAHASADRAVRADETARLEPPESWKTLPQSELRRPVEPLTLPDSMRPLADGVWSDALRRLRTEYLETYCVVREELDVRPVLLSSNVLYLAYRNDDFFIRSFARDDRHRRAVQAILKEITGEKYEIVFDPSEAKLDERANADIAKIREAQLKMILASDAPTE